MAKTRISSRAMNNVVIFAMLFMIVLFNLKTFLPESSTPASRPLVPQDGYILRIEQDGFALKRAGQSWRQSALTSPVTITPEQQLSAWQQASIVPVSEIPASVTEATPFLAVVWLAGQNEGEVLGFYPTPSATFVQLDKQWYTLKDASLTTLLPWNSTTTD
ncbi:hypothetical protein [Salinimonas lutimaris]|uniref:hypothetical protein n=1 Tax=Salinimonas lutimaris TaxID=914153 RepID=UPI0010BFE276|nr:hypothetical protein [Salinimonas lutimaris]